MNITKADKMKIRRIISAVLMCLLIIDTSFAPLAAAQEVSPTPTEAPAEQTSSADTTTGDAQSGSTTDLTANQSEQQVEGSISTNGCSVDGSVDCPIDSTKEAETDNSTTSSSVSGENNIDGTDNGSIDTGDSGANSATSNTINTTVVEITPPEDSTDEATFETTDGASPDEASISLQNEVDHAHDTSADSTSGANSISASESGEVTTGDAISSASQVNILNTNIVASEFELILLDILTDENGDINLNNLWKLLEAQATGLDSAQLAAANNDLSILIQNQANANLTVSANAVSGDNSVQAEQARITSGNAYASANLFNLINLNIIGSRFLFAVINIFGNYHGNIIVPSLERFLEGALVASGPPQDANITTNDTATIVSTTQSTAVSGENMQEGQDLSIQTGEALSYTSSTHLANLNLFLSNWYFLLLNNFGFWDGLVLGWDSPSSNAAQVDRAGNYSTTDNPQPAQEGALADASSGTDSSSWVDIQNQATVNAQVSANAISGRNSSTGLVSEFLTGRAIALANLFNIINANIVGTRFFAPIINLFGTWTGNLIFAYPDLVVTIQTNQQDVVFGDTITYTVSYRNIGYEDARGAAVSINLPTQENIVSLSGPAPSSNGTSYTFGLGDVASGGSGSFSFSTIIQNNPQTQKTSDSFLSRVIEMVVPTVHAADNAITLTTMASINSSDSESNTTNNSSTVVKYLQSEQDNFETTPSTQTTEHTDIQYASPTLEVTSTHNVSGFTYPGNTITFTATAGNVGAGTSYDTYIYQTIYTAQGFAVVENKFKVADLAPGVKKTFTFGLKIPAGAPQGTYTSLITAEGLTENAVIVLSNDSETNFQIKNRGLTFIKQAHAGDGSVLGATGACTYKKDYLPYILASFLTALWFVEVRKRQRLESELKEAFNKAL